MTALEKLKRHLEEIGSSAISECLVPVAAIEILLANHLMFRF